jgi:pilus assembly protein CpaB
MKSARLVILAIALCAGAAAAFLASGSPPPQAPVIVERPAAPNIETIEVLVAGADIPMGQTLSPDNLKWTAWPAASNTQNFVRKTDQPDAREKFAGAIVRSSFVAGEPIREAKIIKANGSGFMSAILPAGMRAVSTDISVETGAGGFILPNDRVDVILTKRERQEGGGGEVHTTQTILVNTRVLAIDQTIEEDKEGKKSVVGRTATLELSSRQAETLALSRQQGSLSLALRSLADANVTTLDGGDDQPRAPSVIKFGVTQTRSAN